jgi:hypothetical protein
MTQQCIHGFRTDECASCQTCPHGLTASRCGRCAAASTSAARRAAAAVEVHPSEEYAGFEIYFDAAVSGWYYRAADDDATSPTSYRSAFLARKAVDGLGNAPKPTARGTKRS